MRFSILWLALALTHLVLGAEPLELTSVPAASQPLDTALASGAARRQVEEDWLRQAKAIEDRALGAVRRRPMPGVRVMESRTGSLGFIPHARPIHGGKWI